jgi:hypothetical protein
MLVKEIATGQFGGFRTRCGSSHPSTSVLLTVFFVITVDFRSRNHTGDLRQRVIFATRILLYQSRDATQRRASKLS